MTVVEFIGIDLKEYTSPGGKKIKWIDRQILKLYQKKLERMMNKHQLDGAVVLSDTSVDVNPNKRGLFSLILAGLGLAFLFVPGVVGSLGIIFAIAGTIMGIIGLKRDEEVIFPLVGTILGALLTIIYVITLIG